MLRCGAISSPAMLLSALAVIHGSLQRKRIASEFGCHRSMKCSVPNNLSETKEQKKLAKGPNK
jgi:hypothetical protein